MKIIGIYFLFGIILFSKNSVAQSFTKDDLPGAWLWGSRPVDLKMTFVKDSMLVEERNEYIDLSTYSLDSIVDGYILSIISKSTPAHSKINGCFRQKDKPKKLNRLPTDYYRWEFVAY